MRVPVRRLNVTVGRIGNGVQIPDRTAAVMPSDAQCAIGANPRRPRGAMRLSQKTCPRSVYRFFGLKRDMFLVRARLRVFRQRAALAFLYSCGIYRFLAGMSRFFMCVPGNPLFSRYRAPLKTLINVGRLNFSHLRLAKTMTARQAACVFCKSNLTKNSSRRTAR